MNVRRIAQLLPLVAIIYLVGPVGFQVLNASGTTGAAEYRQLETAARTLNAAEVVNWQSLASAWSRPDTASTPIVLTYHDVAEDSDSEYAVTPLQFAEQISCCVQIVLFHLDQGQPLTRLVQHQLGAGMFLTVMVGNQFSEKRFRLGVSAVISRVAADMQNGLGCPRAVR